MLLLCYLCPPLAVFAMGRPGSAILNTFLTCCLFWVPGVRHALVVYADWVSDKKFNRVVDAVNHPAYIKAGGGRPTVVNNYYSDSGSSNPHTGKNGTVFRRR